MRVMRLFMVTMFGASLSACGSMPTHKDVRMAEVATLEVNGGPGMEVWVDGKLADQIAANAKSVRLELDGGNHAVIVKRGGVALYERSVFLQRGTVKVVDVKP